MTSRSPGSSLVLHTSDGGRLRALRKTHRETASTSQSGSPERARRKSFLTRTPSRRSITMPRGDWQLQASEKSP